jgi:phage terminase small subunit
MGAKIIGIGRGRPRKPGAIKRLSGTARGDRENKRAPQLEPVAISEAPEDAGPDEIAAWAELAPSITRMRVASAADLPAFRSMCQALGMARRFAQMGDVDGWAKADARWEKWASHFGLSPAVREKISTLGTEPAADRLAEFRR